MSAARAPRVQCGDNGHDGGGAGDARRRGAEWRGSGSEGSVALHGIPKLSVRGGPVNPRTLTLHSDLL